VSVRVHPVTFSVWCDECRTNIGAPWGSRAAANRAANAHRRLDRARAAPPLVVHEAKLGEVA